MRPYSRTTLALMAALIPTLIPAPLAAQQGFLLDEIVFSPTRTPTALSSTGSAVSVIGRDQIAAGGFQLSDILARQPGVTVVQTGPLGAPTQLRIRGSETRYIATFVDGIRIDDPSQPQTQLDAGPLLAADAGRIEILRGSQSALWGGSAVAGVISVSSLGATEDGLSQTAAIEGGSYRTLGLRYSLAQRSDRGELALNLSHLRSRGFSAADENDGNTDPDGFRSRRAGFALRHAVTDTLTLGAAGFIQRSIGDYDAGFPIADAPNESRRREAGARVFAEFRLGDSTQEIGVSRYRIARRFIEPAPPFPSDNSYTGTRTRIDWVGSTPLAGNTTLVYGADWEREGYDQSGTFGGFQSSTRIGGVFLQALAEPVAGLNLTASARVDDHSRFGRFTSGRLALAWAATDALTLRATAARGFRAPSNFELFSAFGDPTLTPETSRSLELGADLALASGAVLGVTLFDLRLRNAIDFAGAGYTNIPGTSRRRGVELTAEAPLGDRFHIGANYTYTDARTIAGTRLARVPRHDLSLSLETRLTERLTNTTTLQALGGRPDDGGRSMPGFGVVNTRFALALTDRAELSLRIDNLFDKQYQLAGGYGTSDRAIYLGIAARF